MIEVWGRKNAYNVQKVIWTLHELGLDYVQHDTGSAPGDLETDAFLAMNPHARIPVLSDKGEFIWESNTIIRYLASAYRRGDLWHDRPLTRTHAERWMDWELATLQPDFIDLFWQYYRTPEQKRDAQKIALAQKRCEAHYQQLNQHLERHAYLAGQVFSMADIPCATGLYRYFSMGLTLERPKYVMAWYARLAERRGFQACIMVPYAELKGREVF